MNYGLENEYNFVDLFNNKFFYELDQNSQKFLLDLFGNIFDSDNRIVAWKNKLRQKADIFIKYKNYTKGISIKCFNGFSMHREKIEDFKNYLYSLGIPYKIVKIYADYHFGYYRDENGKNDYNKRLSAVEYKNIYQNEIDEFNKYINKTRILVDMVDRFIVRGNTSNYDIDAIVCGVVIDYVWVLKHDLYDLFLSIRDIYIDSPHISCLTIGPKTRVLSDETKNIKDRYYVSIRWYFMRNTIIEFKNKKN